MNMRPIIRIKLNNVKIYSVVVYKILSSILKNDMHKHLSVPLILEYKEDYY